MKNYKEGVGLVDKKYKVTLLDINTDINGEINLIKTIIPKDCCYICDIRDINNEYINEIKKNCLKFVLFDDFGIKNIRPDILINPTPFCYYDYKKSDYPNTILLLGEKFFLINQPLISKAYVRNFKREKYNIMASFGGADPCGITEFFIRNIVPELKKHNISIILGPAYGRKFEVIKKYKNIANVKFYTNIYTLDDVFLNNDIAFLCGGDTCIEACASGIATFIISSIYYEKKIGKLLHKKKMAYFVTDIEDIKNNSVDDKYLKILEDNKILLNNLSEHGMDLVDGRGQERIYDILLAKI